jgi:hypothetical protein
MGLVAIGPRAIAAAVLAGGVLLSASIPATPHRAPLMKEGFVVLAGDFHVHSFPGDGALPPWELAREARRRGLDVIGLTNHNAMLSYRVSQLLAPLTGTDGAMLIQGQELTAVGYHIAAIGVDRTIAWRQPAAAAVAAIHAAGGVAIAAHPTRKSQRAFDDAAVDALDGVEAAHPAMHTRDEHRRAFAAFYERATRRHPGIAAIGSSDFHSFAPLGLCRTYVFARSATSAGVLDAIRAGSTAACDGRGQAYGPAHLVELIRDECLAAARPPIDSASWTHRIATAAVWLALFALVVLGPGFEAGLE